MHTRTRRLLACGATAPVVLLAGVAAQDILTPGYDPTRQYVSHLSLGPYGWVNSVLLVATGLLVVLFAVGLRHVARRRRVRGLWAAVCAMGASLVGAGLFATDPGLGFPPGAASQLPSWHGTVHDVAGGVLFLATVAGCVLAGRGSTATGPLRLRWASYGAAAAVVLLFALTSVLAALDYSGAVRPGMAGLAERAYLAAVFAWVLVLARDSLRVLGRRRPSAGTAIRHGVAERVSAGPGSSTDRWTS